MVSPNHIGKALVLLLKRYGFLDVVINLHYLGPMIEQVVGNGSRYGVRITYSREPVIFGTGGGIKQAEPYFSGSPVLILNGDTLVEIDLEALWAFSRTKRGSDLGPPVRPRCRTVGAG